MKTLELIEEFNSNRNQAELEYFLLFAIAVAGKTAKTIANALNIFFNLAEEKTKLKISNKIILPSEYIKRLIELNLLKETLQESKIGQYNKIEKAFTQFVNLNLDLRKCNHLDLEQIYGIGKKTSRFFLLYNRENVDYACLDTHILKFMKDELKINNVPKNTPVGKKYDDLEKKFIEYAYSINKKPAELDLQIWKKYNKSGIK